MQKADKTRILSFNLLQTDKDITSYSSAASTISAVSEVKNHWKSNENFYLLNDIFHYKIVYGKTLESL